MKSVFRKTIGLAGTILLIAQSAGQMVLADDTATSGAADPAASHCCHHEDAACSSTPVAPVNLDLSSTSQTVVANHIVNPVNIDVGGASMAITQGMSLTPAQLIAAYQVARGGEQSLLLGADGAAIGGSFILGSRLANHISDLVIPTGVSVINRALDLNLTGNLTNAGSIYSVSNNPEVTAASISALNILNGQSGLISTVLPTSLGLDLSQYSSVLNLSLSAINNIVNYGSITSSGNLTASAGGSIQNLFASPGAAAPLMQAMNSLNLQASQIINQGDLTAQMANINLATSSLVNQGTIQALAGNLNFTSVGTVENINVNGLNGLLEALNGNINFRDSLYTEIGNISINGGDYFSKEFSLYSGTGIVDINVGEITGRLNISAGAAHVKADTQTLTLGSNCLLGDPTYYNTGNIDIDGPITTNEALAIVAGGNITATSTTASIYTGGYNLLMIAGATIDDSGCVGCSSSGALNGNPPSGGVVAGQSIDVDLNTPTGGNIDLSLSTVGTGGNYIIDTSSGGGSGGSVTLVALKNGDSTGYIYLNNPNSTSSINTAGGGAASGGAVTIYAGGADPLGNFGITTGDINTAGGAITLVSSQATGNLTLDSSGQIAAGAISQGSLGLGGVSVGNINTDGYNGIGGLSPDGGNGGALNILTAGDIQIFSASTVGGLGALGLDGAPLTNGADGGNGGNGGNITLQAGDGRIFSSFYPYNASGGDAGDGGTGGDGDGTNPGGDGGNGGNGGLGGAISLVGSTNYINEAITNNGGDGGAGGNGGGPGAGLQGGNGGNGGNGSNAGSITIISTSGVIDSAAACCSAFSSGGNGGTGGLGSILANGGNGGAGGNASSAITISAANSMITFHGVTANGGNGGSGGQGNANGGDGGQGGIGASVLMIAARTISGFGDADYFLQGGIGGNGAGGNSIGGVGANGGQGGLLNVLSGGSLGLGQVTVEGGAAGNGGGGNSAGVGGNGGRGGSILLSAVDTIDSGDGFNNLGDLTANGGVGGTGGEGLLSAASNGGNGGQGGYGGSIVITTLGDIYAGNIYAVAGVGGGGGKGFGSGGSCGDGGAGNTGGSISINALDNVTALDISANGGNGGAGGGDSSTTGGPGSGGTGGQGGYIQATIFGSFEHSYISALGGSGGAGNLTTSGTNGGNGGYGGFGGGVFLFATEGISGLEVNVNGGNGGSGGDNTNPTAGNGGSGFSGGDGGYLSLLSGRDVNELNLYANGGVGGDGGNVTDGSNGGAGGAGGNGGQGGLVLVTAQRDINTTTILAFGGFAGSGGSSAGGTPGTPGNGLAGGVALLQAGGEITIGDSGTPGTVQGGSITFITNYTGISPVLTKVLPTAGIYTVQAGDLDNSGVSITGSVFALSSLTVVQNTTGTDLLIDQIGGSSDTQSYDIAAGGGSGQGIVSTSSVDTLLTGSGIPPLAGYDVVVLSESNITTNTGVGTIDLSSGSSAPGGQVIMVAGTVASVVLGNYGTGTGISPFLITGGSSADGGSVNLAGGTAINITTNANLVHLQALPATTPSGTEQIYIGDIQTSAATPLAAEMSGLSGGSIVLAASGSIFTGALFANGATGAAGDNAGAGGSGGLVNINSGDSVVIDRIFAEGGSGGLGNGTDGTMGGMGGSGTLVAVSAATDITFVNNFNAGGGLGGAGDRGGRGGNGGTLNLSALGSITTLDLNVLGANGGAGGSSASNTYGGGGGQGGYIQVLAAGAVSGGQILADAGRGGNCSAGAGGLGGVGGVVGIQTNSTIDLLSISAFGGRGGDGGYFGGSGNDGGAVSLLVIGSAITLSSSGINVNGGDASASGPFANGNAGYGGTVSVISVRIKINGGINANGGAAVTENSGGGSISLLTASTTVLLRVGSGSGNNYVNGSILANGMGSGYGGRIDLASASGLSLEGGANLQAESSRGLGGAVTVASAGPTTVNSGSSISADGAAESYVLILTAGDNITIDSGATVSASGTDGLVEFATLVLAPLRVVNDGDISAGSIVGFNNGPDGVIQISGAGTINAGEYVNVGDLDFNTGEILPPFVTVDPFTGSFTLGNISIAQSSITGTLQVSGAEPVIPTPTTPTVVPSGSSFNLAQYLAYLQFLAELNQIGLNQQNMLNEQLGTRIATDYTPILIQIIPKDLPLQGNVSVEQLAANVGAIFSSGAFSSAELNALANQGVLFGPKSGGNFFDLNKGYVLFMPTSDIKVQTKEGLVSIPKGTIAWVMETGNDVAIYDLHDSITSPLKVMVNNKEMTMAPGMQMLLTRDGKASFETLNPGGSIGTRNVTEEDMGQGIKAYFADFTISGGMANVSVLRNLLNSNNPEHLKAANKMLKNAAILSDLGGYKTPYKAKP